MQKKYTSEPFSSSKEALGVISALESDYLRLFKKKLKTEAYIGFRYPKYNKESKSPEVTISFYIDESVQKEEFEWLVNSINLKQVHIHETI